MPRTEGVDRLVERAAARVRDRVECQDDLKQMPPATT